MKTKYIVKGLIATLALMLTFSSCETFNEAVIENLDVSREFSPLGLTAKIRNSTTVELNWTVKKEENPDHYVVEFSADDPNFTTIFKTVNVAPTELPVQVALEGETVYSIRVKAVSATGLEDSKWSVTTATTLSEQIFFPVQDADIDATKVTLRWTPNSAVTHITVMPGNITHTITADEKAAGVATITGLTGETDYAATLYNGTKKRGNVTFKTGIDIGTGILVKPEDDLNAKIAAAEANAVLVLMPGDYNVYTGEIILNKPITIRGLRVANKPKLSVRFTLNSGASALSLIDLELDGKNTQTDIVKYNQNGNYGKLLVSGCTIHDYQGSFTNTATGVAAKIESITVENSVMTNIDTASTGEFIDFRTSIVSSIVLTKSTFNSCAAARAFIRLDAATGTGTGLISNVLIDGCTLYKVTNTTSAGGYQILYIRFVGNATTVRNSLFAETIARYANQAATVAPTFANNNYYIATTLNAAAPTAPLKSDSAGTSLNPQFVDAATGNFKVQNQTIIDNNIGDPRWLK
ncbi:DUF5123 domain-containing protein [Flavobacterium sp. LHD-85]|uniref:DUF5123 domain-containing protein n=1 Tax=Flavobacterium sp. LHD-85 TaxID=3071410 RepID=UPI0027DF158A|nr:DUF4957 domain-containing protein [Flavobacterium sp. LHD-85]MDQ6529757.1 DUF4957 domain-containing protein [Flavobacterium sp. LHD-85]